MGLAIDSACLNRSCSFIGTGPTGTVHASKRVDWVQCLRLRLYLVLRVIKVSV